MKAAYRISVGGIDVSSNFAPYLEALSLTDSDGGKSDTLDITLDDAGGMLALPPKGAPIQAAIWWDEPPPFSVGGAVSFSGVTDEPKSRLARGGGMVLSISAKSADHTGKGKEKKNRQKDKASFGDVAKAWGAEAGLSVVVDSSLATIRRDYWAMHNESFLNWARRIANEVGATFKVAHPKAVFVARNSNQSASGQTLPTLPIIRPGNLISYDVTPTAAHPVYANTRAFYYDPAAALWKVVKQSTGLSASVDHTAGHKFADQDHATNKAKSNAASSARHAGGGTFVIVGDPRALSQAPCSVSGARPGVDGGYRIKTAHHTLSRGGGWAASVSVEQPQDGAGSDSR